MTLLVLQIVAIVIVFESSRARYGVLASLVLTSLFITTLSAAAAWMIQDLVAAMIAAIISLPQSFLFCCVLEWMLRRDRKSELRRNAKKDKAVLEYARAFKKQEEDLEEALRKRASS